MKKLFIFLIIPIIIWIGSGCNIINPEEDIPAYIYIDSFNLTTVATEEGSDAHNITDAWIAVDDNLIGAFELPATVPVLANGTSKISIFAGIKENGISSIRLRYPFYTLYSTTKNLTPATIDTIIPSIEYVNNAEFPLIENFENGNDFIGMNTTTDPAKVFEGSRSGRVLLDDANDSLIAVSSSYFLPKDGRQVWLEMNYKNSHDFLVYVRTVNFTSGAQNLNYLITITPQPAWNKIYLNLTSVITGTQADQVNIAFVALKPESANTAEYFWDNIKILHL